MPASMESLTVSKPIDSPFTILLLMSRYAFCASGSSIRSRPLAQRPSVRSSSVQVPDRRVRPMLPEQRDHVAALLQRLGVGAGLDDIAALVHVPVRREDALELALLADFLDLQAKPVLAFHAILLSQLVFSGWGAAGCPLPSEPNDCMFSWMWYACPLPSGSGFLSSRSRTSSTFMWPFCKAEA